MANLNTLRDLFAEFDDDVVPPAVAGASLGTGGGLDVGLARMTVDSDTRLGRARSLVATEGGTGTFGRDAALQRPNFPSLFVNTTDPEDYDTPLGQQSANSEEPFTIVDSVNDSEGITITSTASGSVTSLHNIFIFSLESREMYSLCLKHIGTGITVCVRRDCRVNHRGAFAQERHTFSPGTIAVLKDRSTVFISPTSNVEDVSDEVLMSWQAGPRRSLSEWVSVFQNAENAKAAHGFVTTENLESESTFQTYASRFRSPRYDNAEQVDPASKFGTFGMLTDELQAALKRKTIDAANEAQAVDNPTARKKILLMGTETPETALYILEKSIEAMKNVMSSITKKMDEKSDLVSDEMRVILTRTQGVESSIGKRVEFRNPSLEAPTVWSSIALLTNAIDEIHKVVDSIPQTIFEPHKREIRGSLHTMETMLKDAIKQATEPLREEMKKTQSSTSDDYAFLSDAMVTLARNTNTIKGELRVLKGLPSAAGVPNPPPPESASETGVAELMTLVKDLTQRVDALTEDRASKAAKFFGLTLRSGNECNKWVAANLEDDHLGVIVDVHLVFEHLFNQAYAGDGVLKTLQGLYKVQIDTITQGLACSSFDTRIPKFFKHHKATETTETVVKKADVNKSALDRIGSWEEWDSSNSGKRALLEAHLSEFKMTHSMLLNDLMPAGTPAYNIAMLSASASTNWITDLISYIDRTYREFHNESGFTTERAWYIVSHLVHRIFTELSDPRVGVLGLLRLKSNAKTSQLITWPLVQCHEVMKTFERSKFKDHPCISNEYVKFIMTNSSADGVSAKVTALQELVKEVSKSAKSASASAVTASNGVTEVKKLISDLTKKVDQKK